MEEQKIPDASDALRRRKRVVRIKRFIVGVLLVCIFVPNIISIYLLYRLNTMNVTLNQLQSDIGELKNIQVLSQQVKQEVPVAITEHKAEDSPILSEISIPISDEEVYPDQTLVYLTFDDGPSKYTDEILDILKEYNVKATFFVVAKEGYEEQYQRIMEEGHTLGLHSYSHKYSDVYQNVDSFASDIELLSDFVESTTGLKSHFYRFPGGSSNQIAKDKQGMIHYLQENSYTYFDWNVSSGDANSRKLSATAIVSNVVSGVEGKKSAVVLMHDAAEKSTTVEALPVLIEKLKEDSIFLPITDSTTPIQHVCAEETGDDKN